VLLGHAVVEAVGLVREVREAIPLSRCLRIERVDLVVVSAAPRSCPRSHQHRTRNIAHAHARKRVSLVGMCGYMG
jgi:hypothetical protein